MNMDDIFSQGFGDIFEVVLWFRRRRYGGVRRAKGRVISELK
jgi:hypothetical protein